MDEFLEEATEELKRVDHLIYVSLKYTRTVDVFKSILDRLIACFDITMNGLLQKAKAKGKVASIPVSPMLRAESLKKLHAKREEFLGFIDFYIFLRKLNHADYTKKNEYRRHVTMTAIFPSGENVEVTMDTIHGYYDRAREFVKYVGENLQ